MAVLPEGTYDTLSLKAELSRDEGRKSKPYRDSEGILTIGVGWNLEANPLPDEVIVRFLVGDLSISSTSSLPPLRNTAT